jgi:hypothetical protein
MREKVAAEADLAVARPFFEEANSALDSINAQDIVELKGLSKPSDIIKLVFDVVLILMKQPVNKVTLGTLILGVGRTKQSIEFLADSYPLAKVKTAECTRRMPGRATNSPPLHNQYCFAVVL